MDSEDHSDLSLVRTRSPVITTFPWLSAAVCTRPDLRTFANSQHSFAGFLNHLRQFERVCLFSPQNKEGKYYRHLLQLEFTMDTLPILRAKPGQKINSHDWAVRASVVCAYRLADTIALLETEPNITATPVPRALKNGPSLPLQWFYRLENWVKLLLKFKKANAGDRKPRHQNFHAGHTHIGLLKSIVQCSSAGDLNNISANLFSAALHLQYLMKHSFEDGQLPELTENFQELTVVRLGAHDALSSSSSTTSLSDDELAFWTDTFENGKGISAGKRSPSSGRERQSLHLALAISPLYLLIPNQILNKAIGRENVLTTSMALGNQRPVSLMAVEKAVWKVLFRLAQGTLQPSAALDAIDAGIDWKALETCSNNDQLWFKLLKRDTSAPKNPKAVALEPQAAILSEMDVPSTSALSRAGPMEATSSHFDDGDQQDQRSSTDSEPPSFYMLDHEGDEEMMHDVEEASRFETYLSNLSIDQTSTLDPPNGAVSLVGILDNQKNPGPAATPSNEPTSRQLEMMDVDMDSNIHLDNNVLGVKEAMHVDPAVSKKLADGHTLANEDESEEEKQENKGILDREDEDEKEDTDEDEEGDEDDEDSEDEDVDKVGHGADEKEGDDEDEDENDDKSNARPMSKPPKDDQSKSKATPARRSVRLLLPGTTTLPQAPKTRGQAAAAAQSDLNANSSSGTTARGRSSAPKRRPKKKLPPPETAASLAETKAGTKRKDPPEDNDELIKPPMKKPTTARATSLVPVGGESQDNPIDVDGYSLFVAKRAKLYERVATTLSPLLSPPTKRYTLSDTFRVWDASNVLHEIQPRLHSPEELVKLGLIMQSVSKSDVDQQARHVSAPASSIFHKMDYKSYKRLSHAEAERILKRQCIVVSDMEWDDMDFNEEGLSTLGPLDAVVSIQGMLSLNGVFFHPTDDEHLIDLSLPHPQDDLSERVVQGTTQQILESARGGASGKALNGLSFPFDSAELERTPYAACRVAWKSTSRTVFQTSARMPVSDVHWGLAATEGAMTFWHIDSDGLATTVDVRTGEKLWIAATGDPEQFSRLGLLLSNDFDIDRPPQTFQTEAVLLTKNTRLIMRPNVIHSAYTSKHTICHGSHFYSTGAMQSTLVSLVHGFICHGFITNISHPETRIFLRRIVHFYHRGLVEGANMMISEKAHLPQIDAPSGSLTPMDEVANFLSACALVFFSNALDPRTYTPPGMDSEGGCVANKGQKTVMNAYDANAIAPEEREEICAARGATLEVLAWFRHSFVVCAEGEDEPVDLISRYFTTIARSLLRYKHVAQFNKVKSAADFTTKDLEAQVENLLQLDTQSWTLWKASHKGKWRDSEMKKAALIKVTGAGCRLKINGLGLGQKEDGEVEDLEDEDGEFEGDRELRLEDVSCSPPKPSIEAAWRKETLTMEHLERYTVLRGATNFTTRGVDHRAWKAAGSSEFDRRYYDAMEWRQREEVNMLKARLHKSQ